MVHISEGSVLQDGAPQPDENAIPPPLDDAASDVDSHALSEIADMEDVNEQQAGSDDEGEDLMDNMSGSVCPPTPSRPIHHPSLCPSTAAVSPC